MNSSLAGQPARALKGPSALAWAATVAVAAGAGAGAAVAVASGPASTVRAVSNSSLGERIVVDSQGRTLYTLGGETTKHLLCTSSACLGFWPPATVSSSHAKLVDSGVSGRLGILRRSNGKFQLTLGGHPLYRFSQDKASGDVNGNGIKSFGGTWRVVPASASSSSTPAAKTTPSTSSTATMTTTTTTMTTTTTPPTTTTGPAMLLPYGY
jgi:predicted lipoprotein with Yx(FWY)xxD motif